VRLSIYDVTGRLVRRLVDRAMAAGEHRLVWDGRADSGADVVAGVYFARLEIGDFRETARIVLLRSGR
jgi:flagellar hook assembly protein FlgD